MNLFRKKPGRQHSLLHLLFLVLTLLYGCSSGASVNDGFYNINRIIDGDTIELSNGSKVRYIGINTPETRKKISGEWIFSPERFSVKAKNFNDALLSDRKIKLVLDKEKTDTYGRMLAYVYLENGKMVNAELIKNGLATVYTFYPNIWCKRRCNGNFLNPDIL